MIEMGPLKSENQAKKSLSHVESPLLPRLGEGALQCVHNICIHICFINVWELNKKISQKNYV